MLFMYDFVVIYGRIVYLKFADTYAITRTLLYFMFIVLKGLVRYPSLFSGAKSRNPREDCTIECPVS
jgi:hypothetical protein